MDGTSELSRAIKVIEAQIVDSGNFAASMDAPDYLGAMEQIGLVRWAPETMPIKVYIKDSSSVRNYRPQLVEELKQALDTWEKASAGHVKFAYEQDPARAQIECSWTNDPKQLP